MRLRFLISLLLSASVCAQTDFATERLYDIARAEEKIYKRIAEDPEFYSDQDLEKRINDLVQAYRTYLTDNPNDVNALILYGKLLRRVDEKEQAFQAFLKADELNPKIAVVKQQIGTYLAETEKGKAALTFYLSAIQLEPETAVYHFALGKLLHEFEEEFLSDGIFTRDALDRETLKAFRSATKLEPENFSFQMRLGEAYYDLASPDWKRALLHWDRVRKLADSEILTQVVDLHRACVLGKLGRFEEAEALLKTIQLPSLEKSKQTVIDEIKQF